MEPAVILCGGQGTRLRPLTDDKPKWLVSLNGRTIAEYQLAWLLKNGVKHVILACGYQWEKISAKFGSEYCGMEITYCPESVPSGTLGALRRAVMEIDPDGYSSCFFAVNGDNFSNIDLSLLRAAQDGVGSPVVTFVSYPFPYGVLEPVPGHEKFYLNEKPRLRVNAGVYYLDAVQIAESRGSSIEKDYLNRWFIRPYLHEGYWNTIDSVDKLGEVSEWLKNQE